MKDVFDKFLDKIPTDKLYEDLFRPGLKKAGEALSTVIDVSNLILLPIKLMNEKSKLFLKDNLDRYEEKLSKTKDEDLIQVPEYVGLPILDKLTYVNEKYISEGFINLLTKASTIHTINLVHPSFINVLNNLSSDEAKILFHYKLIDRIQFLDVNVHKYKETVKKPDHFEGKGVKSKEQLDAMIDYAFQDRVELNVNVARTLSLVPHEVKLDFPENIFLYLENLHRNGIMNFEKNQYNQGDEDIYEELENNIYKGKISEYQSIVADMESDTWSFELRVSKGYIIFTEYGKSFIKACIKEIE